MKEKVKVYFTSEITPESLVKIYEAVGKELPGNVGIKISTGEPGGHNYLKPELIKDIDIEYNYNFSNNSKKPEKIRYKYEIIRKTVCLLL